MGKALVIKNVTFAQNKLDTVQFIESIPCTAIELDKESTSMTVIGATETLTATVTPSNTTDVVEWTSSDPAVVSVSGGVLTQTGVGTATITATCGTQTVTCTVTCTNILTYEYTITRQNYAPSGRDYVFNQSSDSSAYAALVSTSEAQKAIEYYQGTGNRYPIILGNGATKVNATLPSTMRIVVWFTDSKTACEYSAEHPTFDYLAHVVSGDRNAYDNQVPLGNREMTIPEGADSAVFGLHYPNGTITDEIVAGIEIVVS